MTTLAVTTNFSPQSISWDIVGALWATLRLLALILIVAAIGACLLGILALVAAIPVTFWTGLALTAVFAVATYPRKKVGK